MKKTAERRISRRLTEPPHGDRDRATPRWSRSSPSLGKALETRERLLGPVDDPMKYRHDFSVVAVRAAYVSDPKGDPLALALLALAVVGLGAWMLVSG